MPDYVAIQRKDFEAVLNAFQVLMNHGHKPFTTPFTSSKSFLELLHNAPETQQAISAAMTNQLEDYDENRMAIIAPVELTVHRAPFLVSLANEQVANSKSYWLLGDAAVSLPITKGCNLVHHIASAG